MTNCCVKRCHNRTDKNQKDKQNNKITFHVFPVDPIIAHRWAAIIKRNRKDDCWKPKKDTRICSKHFRKKDMYITKNGLRKISPGVVPTKRLAVSSSESDSSSDENPPFVSDFSCVSFNLESECSTAQPSTSTNNKLEGKKLQVKAAEKKTAKLNTDSGSKHDSSDSDTVLETPREQKLRRELRKRMRLQIKHVKLIKNLHQKNRRLETRNAILKQVLKKLRKHLNENDSPDILSENLLDEEACVNVDEQ